MSSLCRFFNSRRTWSRSFSQHSLDSAFQQLGLSMDATPAEVKAAYRRRALQCHPDLHVHSKDGKEFVRITAAYERIMNRGPYQRRVVSAPPHVQTKLYHMPVALLWVSLLLGSILFWYPFQMYLQNRRPIKEPSLGLQPSRDAVKRERIAAILFERQRKEKRQDEGLRR